MLHCKWGRQWALLTQNGYSCSQAVTAAKDPGGLLPICQPLQDRSSIREEHVPCIFVT